MIRAQERARLRHRVRGGWYAVRHVIQCLNVALAGFDENGMGSLLAKPLPYDVAELLDTAASSRAGMASV